MDIQVGDRVTYKDKNDNKIKTIIVDCDSEAKNYENDFETKYHEILKIERPKYEIVEGKEDLLTEEEREYLKTLLKYSPYEIKFIRKVFEDFLDFIDEYREISFDMRLKDNMFVKLQENKLYTLEELKL